MPSTAFDELRSHLESVFQFENNDLDFGIYKVLRLDWHPTKEEGHTSERADLWGGRTYLDLMFESAGVVEAVGS